MFSLALSVGSRLNCWKTKPILSRRSSVSCFSVSRVMSTSPMNACPELRRSSPAAHCMSVDLPDPDGPMIAVNRPGSKPTVTPSSARTSASPEPYTLVAPRTWAAQVSVAVTGWAEGSGEGGVSMGARA